MPRIRDPNRDKAFELYRDKAGNIELVEIANQLNVPPGTIRGWKNKDRWEEKLSGTLQTNKERSKNKCVQKKTEVVQEIEELDKSNLSDKQKLFCVYYAKYFNASKAALKAGYSQSYAVSDVYNLLDNPRVKEEIQRLKRNRMGRAMLSEDDIFQKMIDIAFADITDYLEFGQEEIPVMTMYGALEVKDKETGKKKPVTKMVNTVKFKESHEIDGTLISEVKQGKDGASIKLADKMKALQWLADRMDLLPRETQLRLENENTKLKMAQEKHDKEMGSNNKEPIKIEFIKASQK